ncbi:hypothetical protein ACQPZJ_00755 [Actinoplanes sp. CA-054009]
MVMIVDQRGSRLAGWSMRRRWALAILLMVSFLCSGLLAVPVVAFLEHTDDQGDAFGTATEAVDSYLLQLNAGEEIGLRRGLAEDHRDDLMSQWRSILGDMRRTDPLPSRLTWERFDTLREGRNEVEISVPVSGVWWGERGVSSHSEEHAWVFVVDREDGGWRVESVRPYAWCGGHVLIERCRPL